MKTLVYLSLLVGFVVLMGCAGEGAGSSVGGNSNRYPPDGRIEWEKKVYWTGTINDDFDGRNVLVVMDKNVGGVNKVHDKNFFGGIEIESIRDLTYFTIDADEINNLGIDWEKWRQILCLTLPGDSKENVVRAIRQLEKIDGIRSAEPNGSVRVSPINY